MKNRISTIAVSLVIGFVIGLLVSPSIAKRIGKDISETNAKKKQIIATAMTAMQGKKVCLQSEHYLASAAANELISLGATYAPKDQADFLISTMEKGRLVWPDLDFRDRNGKLLHRVPVSEQMVARDQAVRFAWSLAKHRI